MPDGKILSLPKGNFNQSTELEEKLPINASL